MDFEVSDETRQRTDRCWRGFACLSGEEDFICEVEESVGDVVFVNRSTSTYCPYDVTFGYSHMCSCPVRREIYERYGE